MQAAFRGLLARTRAQVAGAQRAQGGARGGAAREGAAGAVPGAMSRARRR